MEVSVEISIDHRIPIAANNGEDTEIGRGFEIKQAVGIAAGRVYGRDLIDRGVCVRDGIYRGNKLVTYSVRKWCNQMSQRIRDVMGLCRYTPKV